MNPLIEMYLTIHPEGPNNHHILHAEMPADEYAIVMVSIKEAVDNANEEEREEFLIWWENPESLNQNNTENKENKK